MPESTANHTLANGLKLLGHLAAEYREFSVAELAAHFSRPRSHIHRLLQTLVESGLVLRSEDTRKYLVGYRVLALAGAVADQMPLRRFGRPVLHALSESARNASYLIVPDGNEPMVIMTNRYRGRERSGSLGLGHRLSVYASASGKLFLAYNRIAWPDQPLVKINRRTITEKAALRAELKEIRCQGYSVNRAENNELVYSFAAPVFSQFQEVIAAVGLTVSAPLVVERGEAEFVQYTVDAAETLSSQKLC